MLGGEGGRAEHVRPMLVTAPPSLPPPPPSLAPSSLDNGNVTRRKSSITDEIGSITDDDDEEEEISVVAPMTSPVMSGACVEMNKRKKEKNGHQATDNEKSRCALRLVIGLGCKCHVANDSLRILHSVLLWENVGEGGNNSF